MIEELKSYTTEDPELSILIMKTILYIEQLERRNKELSWSSSPDRMGGQFTYDEQHRNDWI